MFWRRELLSVGLSVRGKVWLEGPSVWKSHRWAARRHGAGSESLHYSASTRSQNSTWTADGEIMPDATVAEEICEPLLRLQADWSRLLAVSVRRSTFSLLAPISRYRSPA